MDMSHAGDNGRRTIEKNSLNGVLPFLLVKHGLITSDFHFYLPSKVCEIILALLQNEIQPFFKCIPATHTIEIGKVGTER